MAHLTNPLATPSQLYALTTLNSPLPIDLQHSIRFYTARLTQAAVLLLRLPQDITAQANVLLYRYWLVDPLLAWEFSDVSAATLYLTAKISASPRTLRSITNVYTYLLSLPSFPSPTTPALTTPPDPESYYLTETAYTTYRNRLLNIEGQILNAISFTTHVSLPHPLAITYLQTLSIFSLPPSVSTRVAKRTIAHLNTALLSPQMLYLTHQPPALATAAIYLAAREEGVKLPDGEWWTVFDVEREELGFLCVGMRSLEGFVEKENRRWEGRGVLTREGVRGEMGRLGLNNEVGNGVEEDEESQMARLLDEKVGAVST
ncbi:Cyclin-like protein [Hyaloscypha variabilis]